MTVSITIRDVPDDVRNELAARAARSGRSLQSYLRDELVRLARQRDLDALLDDVEDWRNRHGITVTAEEILAWRDADRR